MPQDTIESRNNANRTTAATRQLRELLNNPRVANKNYPRLSGGLPELPLPPPHGRSGTLTGGIPRVTKAVEALFQIAPELRGRIRQVDVNPEPALMERFMSEGHTPGEFDPNIAGVYNRNTHNISLHPLLLEGNLSGDRGDVSLESVLGHEMGHEAGYPEMAPHIRSNPLRLIENLSDSLLNPSKLKR